VSSTTSTRGDGDRPGMPDSLLTAAQQAVLDRCSVALIAVVVVGAVFVTAEYRRGLIRITLAASPRRGRVLAAKAIVAGAISFVAGLAAAAVVVPVTLRVAHAKGAYVLPVGPLTEIRVIAGTAALLAVAAVLTVAVGTLLRRSAVAVTTGIVVIVLPYILGTGDLLPAGAEQWLLRFTPAAAFAIQQSPPPTRKSRPATRRPPATSRSPRGPASPCCADTPRSRWSWPSTCSAGGTHEQRAGRTTGRLDSRSARRPRRQG
jgi:hypothetical protein